MDEHDRDLGRVADALTRQRGHLVQLQIEALGAHEEYRLVPADDLVRSCDRNVARVASMLRGDPRLPSEIVEDEERSGERRARQGIPAEVVVAAYRSVIGVIRDAFLREAQELDVPVGTVLVGVRRLWDLTDHFSSTLVSARHRVDLREARASEQRRLTLLRRAMDGTLDAEALSDEPAGRGVRADSECWAVRGRWDSRSQEGVEWLERAGRPAGVGPVPMAPVVAAFDDEVVGILGARPEREPATGVVAVVGPVPPARLAGAFAAAAELLAAGVGFGIQGVVDAERLSLRLLVARRDPVTLGLIERYVSPVVAHSPMAHDILQTVRTYLRCDRSMTRVASELSVHGNTVRYRLERYEELTGARLASTDVLVEAWWALQAEGFAAGDVG